MKKIILLIISLILTSGIFAAESDFKTVAATGHGMTEQEATTDALLKILESQYGVSISEIKNSEIQDQSVQRTDTGGLTSTTTSSGESIDVLWKQVQLAANGKILSYQIQNSVQNPTNQTWTVNLTATLPAKYVRGFDPDSRRRIVIWPLYCEQNSINFGGREIFTADLINRIESYLSDQLTQTRKFTVLDRKFENITNQELERLTQPNAAPADLPRLNQKLTTDYLVTGSIRFLESPQQVINPYTGKDMTPDASLAETNFRVLLVPTGQVKWSSTFLMPSSTATGSTIDECLSNLAYQIAFTISNEIINNIYPPRVVAVDNNQIVINQGGNGLLVGEYFDIYATGEMITDVVTGEELGEIESRIGTMLITKVTPKMSYGQLVDGNIADIKRDYIVRRYQPPMQVYSSEEQPADTTTQTILTPTGGVLPPWKQKK